MTCKIMNSFDNITIASPVFCFCFTIAHRFRAVPSLTPRHTLLPRVDGEIAVRVEGSRSKVERPNPAKDRFPLAAVGFVTEGYSTSSAAQRFEHGFG